MYGDVSKESGIWVKAIPEVWLAFVLSCFKIYLLAFSLKNRYFNHTDEGWSLCCFAFLFLLCNLPAKTFAEKVQVLGLCSPDCFLMIHTTID